MYKIKRHKMGGIKTVYRLKAIVKRCVFSCDLKMWGSVQSLIGLGSEFQRVGATVEKALSPRFGAWFGGVGREGCPLTIGGHGKGCSGAAGL